MNNHNNTVKDVAIHNGYAAFWGSIFSNFYPVKINIDGKEFNCTEQYFMYMKAVTFNDMETADEILNETGPKIIKNLGRKVKNYDDEKWSEIRYDIMKKACYAKFTQDEKCKNALLHDSLKYCKFVEGNPYDKVWSVGIEWTNPAIGNPENWKGENLLGKILDEIRFEMKFENYK